MTDTKALTPIQAIKKTLDAKEGSLRDLVPPGHFKKFMANVFAELKPVDAQGRPNKLLNCSPASFYTAAHQAALLGLHPGKIRGHVYMVPYGRSASLLVGYKGYIELAKRHPNVANVHAEVIYRGDSYRRNSATGNIVHESPLENDRSDDNIVGAYCLVTLSTGHEVSLDLNKGQIAKRRARSAAANGNFWKNDFAAMCRKSAVRAIMATGEVPLSTEMEAALEIEQEQEKHIEPISVTDYDEPIVGEVVNAMDPISEDSGSQSWSEVAQTFEEKAVDPPTFIVSDEGETLGTLEPLPEADRSLEPFVTPEELKAEPKRTRAPNKKTTIAEIDGMGLSDAQITSTASDMFSETVLDINVLSAGQLVNLKRKLEEMI